VDQKAVKSRLNKPKKAWVKLRLFGELPEVDTSFVVIVISNNDVTLKIYLLFLQTLI
jgi:hypothetical protein